MPVLQAQTIDLRFGIEAHDGAGLNIWSPNLDDIHQPVFYRKGILSIYHQQKLQGKFFLEWQHNNTAHLLTLYKGLQQKVLQIRIQDHQLTLATLQGTYHDHQARKKIKETLGIDLDWQQWLQWFAQPRLTNTTLSGIKIVVTQPDSNQYRITLNQPPTSLILITPTKNDL